MLKNVNNGKNGRNGAYKKVKLWITFMVNRNKKIRRVAGFGILKYLYYYTAFIFGETTLPHALLIAALVVVSEIFM
jgi:uncharacterized protein (UPF0128 family)